ncbi:unnamed protein product, partial [Staurois parvus]
INSYTYVYTHKRIKRTCSQTQIFGYCVRNLKECTFTCCVNRSICRGGLTIWKLGHCPRARVSRGPHEMPLVPYS